MRREIEITAAVILDNEESMRITVALENGALGLPDLLNAAAVAMQSAIDATSISIARRSPA